MAQGGETLTKGDKRDVGPFEKGPRKDMHLSADVGCCARNSQVFFHLVSAAAAAAIAEAMPVRMLPPAMQDTAVVRAALAP